MNVMSFDLRDLGVMNYYFSYLELQIPKPEISFQKIFLALSSKLQYLLMFVSQM